MPPLCPSIGARLRHIPRILLFELLCVEPDDFHPAVSAGEKCLPLILTDLAHELDSAQIHELDIDQAAIDRPLDLFTFRRKGEGHDGLETAGHRVGNRAT